MYVLPISASLLKINSWDLAMIFPKQQVNSLLQKSFQLDEILDRPAEELMDPVLPVVGLGESAMIAIGKLDTSPVLVVHDAGRPRTLLTQSQVMNSEVIKEHMEVDAK